MRIPTKQYVWSTSNTQKGYTNVVLLFAIISACPHILYFWDLVLFCFGRCFVKRLLEWITSLVFKVIQRLPNTFSSCISEWGTEHIMLGSVQAASVHTNEHRGTIPCCCRLLWTLVIDHATGRMSLFPPTVSLIKPEIPIFAFKLGKMTCCRASEDGRPQLEENLSQCGCNRALASTMGRRDNL